MSDSRHAVGMQDLCAYERTDVKNCDKVYRKERTRGYPAFCVPVSELGEMRLADIPPHSTVDLVGLPKSEAGYEFSLTAVNGGDEGTDDYLSIYGGASLITRADPRPVLDRLRRVFAPMMMSSVGLHQNPSIVLNEKEGGSEAAAVFSFGFADRSAPEVTAVNIIRLRP